MQYESIDTSSPLYPKVLDLRNRVLRIPLGLNLMDEDLREDEQQYILVVMKNEDLIACVQLKPINETVIKLRQMAVELNYQRKGIGSSLVMFAEEIARLQNFKEIELHARKEAIPFYLALEYQVEGDEFEEVGITHFKMKKFLH